MLPNVRGDRRARILVPSFVVATISAIAPSGSWGQATTATVLGTVADMSGATVVDAQVQVRNVAIGIVESVATDSAGRFRVPDLGIGDYEVQASKHGFQTVVDGPTTEVPATPKNNVVEWITVMMPTGLTKDTWVSSVQIKPEYPAVTHHICIGYVLHDPRVTHGVAYWSDYERNDEGSSLPDKGPTFVGGGTPKSSDGNATPVTLPGGRSIQPAGGAEDCYLPGNIVADYRPLHAAKLIRAGSDITFSLHYTPNGTAVTNHVKVGFTVLQEAPARRYVSLSTTAPTDPKSFAIPPNDPNWQSPSAEATFLQDVELVFMMPHMHFRGKDMTYTLEYPDSGRKQIILSVPHYDFNWQLGYKTSIHVPKGAKLHIDAHYDNSVNNKFNPNPNKTVYTMTWEEMMFPFFGVVVDRDAEPPKAYQNSVPLWARRRLTRP